MSWTPTLQVVDLTGVIDNLLAYIEANQGDALTWATGENSAEFTLYPSATGRLATKFPQLMVLDQEHRANEGEGDVLDSTLALTLEGALTGRDADELVNLTKDYALAVESMLVNIPSSTLTGGTGTWGKLLTYQTAFDVVRGNGGKGASTWLQIFQTRCEFQLFTGVY